MFPQEVRDQQRFGVGHERSFPTPFTAQRWLKQLLASIRSAGHAPCQFQLSAGHCVHKACKPHVGEDNLCSDVRIVHAFGALAKQYYRMLWRRSVVPHLPSPPAFAYGGVVGKRREEAIAVQNIMAFRLRTSGVSSALKLYDVKNAFPSPAHSNIRSIFQQLPPSQDVSILLQHIVNHRCELQACDGSVLLQPGSGIPQGSTIATECFNLVCWGAIRQFEDQLMPHNELLTTNMEHCPTAISVATTVFVDDLASRVADNKPSALFQKVEDSAARLDGALDRLSMVQNISKAEALLNLRGPGAHKLTREAFLYGQLVPGCKKEARYLGPYLHWDCSFAPECQRRIDAARRAWYDFRGFWFKRIDMRFKLLVFRCVVVQTLLSGLVAWYVNDHFINKMDSFLVGLLRKLLQGQACSKQQLEDGNTRYRSLTNQQVHVRARVAPVGIELVVARLRWLQTMLAKPREHHQMFAAMFGQFPFEKTLSDHPWLVQLRSDLSDLSQIEEAAWISHSVKDNPAHLLHDAVLREAFCAVDVSELRAKSISVQIPPPGFTDGTTQSPAATRTEFADGHVCELLRVDGSICGQRFQTQKALFAHQRFAQDGEHGTEVHAATLVVTNQCPFCSSAFSSIASAKNHFRRALFHGRCIADSAFLPVEVTPCYDVICPLCDSAFADHYAYHWHVRSHFPDLQHSIELLDTSGLTFPPHIEVSNEPRPRAKSGRAAVQGSCSRATGHGGCGDKKAAVNTGKVVIVKRNANQGSSQHPLGSAPSSCSQPVHPGGHASHQKVCGGSQGNESKGQRGAPRPSSHPCLERSVGGRNTQLGATCERARSLPPRVPRGPVGVCQQVPGTGVEGHPPRSEVRARPKKLQTRAQAVGDQSDGKQPVRQSVGHHQSRSSPRSGSAGVAGGGTGRGSRTPASKVSG